MQGDQGHTEDHGLGQSTKVEGDEGPASRVVDTDILVRLFGLEADDGSVGGLSDEDIRGAINGLAIAVHGRKLVLVLDDDTDPDRFFFEDEIAGESFGTSAYIDGRSLMVVSQWLRDFLNDYVATAGRLDDASGKEIMRSLDNIKEAMGYVDLGVLGGG